jgi:hypothetical protein
VNVCARLRSRPSFQLAKRAFSERRIGVRLAARACCLSYQQQLPPVDPPGFFDATSRLLGVKHIALAGVGMSGIG